MATLTLQPDETLSVDAVLEAIVPTANYGASTSCDAIMTATGSKRRSIVRFDLSAIPPGSTVTSAVFTLTNRGGLTTDQISLHRLNSFWLEGTKNGSGTADGATWNKRDGGANWASPGGDFDATADATLTPLAVTAGTKHDFDVTNLVQEWVDGTPNYGLLIKLTTESGTTKGLQCYSSGNATADNRPKLVVEYTAASVPAGSLLQPDGSSGIDNYITSGSDADNNYGSAVAIHAGDDTLNDRRGLLKFDLSAVPAGATINGATLVLTMVAANTGGQYNVSLHRALSEWFEGVKSGAAPDAGTDGSTWNHRNVNGDLHWGAVGGQSGTDYAAVATDTEAVGQSGVYTWDVTADVADWIAGTAPNYGWWLLNASEATSGSNRAFAASDWPLAMDRPRLVIDYTEAAPGGSGARSFVVIAG